MKKHKNKKNNNVSFLQPKDCRSEASDSQINNTFAKGKQIVQDLEKIIDIFSLKSKDIIDEKILNLLKEFKEICVSRNEAGNEFTISVIGTIKAGKSSLLNALLFNGKKMLAEDFLPTTACLTILHNSPDGSYRAEIEFNEKSRQQLHDKGIKVPDFPHLYISCQNGEEFKKKYAPYIAADLNDETDVATKYVKSVTLYLPNCYDSDKMKICIVDTPGLEDPQKERSDKTKDFLKNTDAIIALSADKFDGSEEEDMLIGSVLKNGISKMLLIRSLWDKYFEEETVREKFEADFFVDRATSEETFQRFFEHSCIDQQKKFRDKMIKRSQDYADKKKFKEEEKHCKELAERKLHFISTVWNYKTWVNVADELHQKNERLTEFYAYPDSDTEIDFEVNFDKDKFYDFSGYSGLIESYNKLKNSKRINYIDMLRTLVKTNCDAILAESQKLDKDYEDKISMLGGRAKEMALQLRTSRENLNSLRENIEKIFDNHLNWFRSEVSEKYKQIKQCIEYYSTLPKNDHTDFVKVKESSAWKRFWKIFIPCLDDHKIKDVPITGSMVRIIDVIGLFKKFTDTVKERSNTLIKNRVDAFQAETTEKLPQKIFNTIEREKFIPCDFLKKAIKEYSMQFSSAYIPISFPDSIGQYTAGYSDYADEKGWVIGDENIKKLEDHFEKSKCDFLNDVSQILKMHCEHLQEISEQWKNGFISDCSNRLQEFEKRLSADKTARDKDIEMLTTKRQQLTELDTMLENLLKLI